MKIINIKNIKIQLVLGLSLFLGFSSCTFDEQTDPNNPSVVVVLENASASQLNNLVVGVESTMRNGLGVQNISSGVMAREFYLFDADPRNTTNLLGKEGSSLENGDFYVTAAWAGRYRAIKNANVLIQAVNNTNVIDEQQRAGYVGFAETIIAYELIEVLKSYGRARIDVVDPDNLGPILEFDAAMTQVRAILENGLNSLSQAGTSFSFDLAGFNGFSSPATFSEFNRAVAAVAALYDGDNSAALTALTASYFNLTGDLNIGPKHVFSQNSGDQTNPVFRRASVDEDDANNGDQIVVHNTWINEADAGDSRVTDKAAVRPDPESQDDLNGTHETRLYASNVSPLDMLRNEELILVYAEANIGTNNPQALAGINRVRNEATLLAYSGPIDDASLTTELLKQRRYSLWGENHRLFDLRRYNLSNTLPIDRTGDQIFSVFPVPFVEN